MRRRERRGGKAEEGREEKGRGGKGKEGSEGEGRGGNGKNDLTHPCSKFLVTPLAVLY